MSKLKGGFPPIKYCPEKDVENKNKGTRERFYAPKINKNINIRQILKENVKKPLIEIEQEKEELEVVDEI